MENPEQSLRREISEWLRYYRQLGFTQVYDSIPGEVQGMAKATKIARPAPVPSAAPAAVFQEATIAGKAASDSPSRGPVVPPSTSLPDLFSTAASRETLEQIRKDLGEDCRRCKLWEGRKSIVFGSGNPNANLVFVGEGPGADEDEQGLPFVGRAGQLLTDMIEKGLKIPRPEVYICNIVKCRPPGNRKPEKDEVAACRQFVERQVDAIHPRVVCALGATAAETLLGVHESMGKLRGHWYQFHGVPLLVSYHPAFLLRDPSKKSEAWADLKMILARLNAPASDPSL